MARGTGEGLKYWAQGRGTFLEGMPVYGRVHTHTHTRLHSKGNFEMPVGLTVGLWTAGGERSSQRRLA